MRASPGADSVGIRRSDVGAGRQRRGGGRAGTRDRRLFRSSRVARRQIGLTVLFGVLSAGLIVLQAGFLADALVTVSTGRGVASIRTDLLALLGVLGARAMLSSAGEVTALHAAGAVKSDLRHRLLDHVVRLGPGWLSGRRTGEVTALATHGLDTLDPYFARFLPTVVLAAVVPPIVLVRIAAADWLSALILVATVPLIPLFIGLIGYSTRSAMARQWRLVGELSGHFLDVVEGLPTLKAFRRGRAQEASIRSVSERLRRSTMSTLRVAFTSALVLEVLATLGTALVAVAVGLRLLHGSLGYGTALVVLLLAPEVYLPIRAFGAQFHASAEGAAVSRQAFDVLDEPLPHAPTPERVAVPDLRRQAVTLHDVALTYPGRDRPVLDGIDLTLEPGRRTVLVGPTGAGKSSILALLLRFAVPTGGLLRVGNVPLEHLPVEAWRREIAWVPQAPHLFAGTLADNIRLGRPDASDAAVRRAVELAEAEDVVAALPSGLATRIGERGLRLSTGQRQRIALARAFLRDPPLLLLDEPTAHLDPVTAAAVRGAVERLMSDRTVLLVTHHAAWLTAEATVLTLRDGRLLPALDEVAS